MTRCLLPFIFWAIFGQNVFAQLDTIHWLPPMHARSDDGPQYLYLSTPEKSAFPVEIRNGQGMVLATLTISNALPRRFFLGNSTDSPVLVDATQLHQPLSDEGLVIVGPQKFYAYLRAHSGNQFHACDLTCKGRAALGTTFRIAHVLQNTHLQARRSNFIGIMATEDSTLISLSEYDAAVKFHIAGTDVAVTAPLKMWLQAGESVVFSQYISNSASLQPPNGWVGALLSSNKPIAVNTGSWIGAPTPNQAHDIGIDQIAPLEQVGKEYILCKGNGGPTLEHPIIVAHFPNTKIWLNGATTPAVTLAAGQAFTPGLAAYSIYNNLYIQASEPVFVYQMIGGVPFGNDEPRTAGLIFVPPVSCAIPNAVDKIFEPNAINTMKFEGGVMLVAMRDSAVSVRIDGTPISLGTPDPVPGYLDFVTYRRLNLFSQNDDPQWLSIVAEGPVQVAMYGRNEPASFAAFFSGFSKISKPKIELTLIGDGICPDTLVARGKFDGVQWMYENEILKFGKDTLLAVFAPGKYQARGYLGVCRRTDFDDDTLSVNFQSPQFPFEIENPSCFGFSNGQIRIGQPSGGVPPYQFSNDGGRIFYSQNQFMGLPAGQYRLVVRDSTGCYNRPLSVELIQPDSFFVKIFNLNGNNPLPPGTRTRLQAMPNRAIEVSKWQPKSNNSECEQCLDYIFYPEIDSWVRISVIDKEGCPATDSILVEVLPQIFAPNIFVANHHRTQNDRFFLQTREPERVRLLQIFDRWGDLMFEKKNFVTNDPLAGWSGDNQRGNPCLPGVYVWIAEVEVSDGNFQWLRGDVTLLR